VSRRLVVIDDDTVIREGLPLLVGERADVVGAFSDVAGYLASPPACDLCLLDLHLVGTQLSAGPQGARAVEAVAATGTPVLIYTNERRRWVLAGCLAAGARGIVHKAEPLHALVEAIDSVLAGHPVVTTALAGLAETCQRHGRLPDLSPRQVEVLRLRARGVPFKSIAPRLGIQRKTAEEHMAGVVTKFADYLHTHSAADLERALGIAVDDLLS
jgi:DNA-binding NarL/FixJ family response regulator